MVARSHFELLDAGTIAALLAALPAGSIPLSALAALTASRIVASDAAGLLTVNAAGTANRLAYWGSAGALAVNAALTQNRVVIADSNGLPVSAAAITADRALISNADGVPTHSTVTAAQLAAFTSSPLVYLSSQTAAGGVTATIDFTGLTVYPSYRVFMQNVGPATDSTALWLRMDSDNGASFDTGNNYAYTLAGYTSGGTGQAIGSTGTSAIILIGNSSGWNMDNSSANNFWSGYVELWNLGDASTQCKTYSVMGGVENTAAAFVQEQCFGVWKANLTVNAIRLMCSSGNFANGSAFHLYGVKAS